MRQEIVHIALVVREYDEAIQFYTEKLNFDLILTGHAHGGQWRIPFLVNGLFAPDQGFFPDYAGGMYKYNDTVQIVSRGLCKSDFVPRIFNPPELVVIDVEPK